MVMVNRTLQASWQALKYILIFCIIQGLYGFMVKVTGTAAPKLVVSMGRLPLEELMVLSRYAVAPTVALGLCYQLFRDRQQRLQANSFFAKPSLRDAGLSLLAGLVMGAALLLARSAESMEAIVPQLTVNPQGLLKLGLLLLVARPLAEEILFRGFVLGELKLHISGRKALVIQAAIYGLLQVPLLSLAPFRMYPATAQLSQGLVATGEGLVYGLAALWSGSLWVPLLMRVVSRIICFFL
ncbi:CAAX protease self-immunity [Anoxynatronum buryatiense]|uniref:CAAX protease self-immunity n=2 Tax=Anoxynatronum buryatiense TaxID=489973 RepID=A0AA46AIL8_9CLOT|nr:CAAX protease self-immunity [Anoxynatronum buryatiense]